LLACIFKHSLINEWKKIIINLWVCLRLSLPFDGPRFRNHRLRHQI
jgi:hypothetical protein